MLRLDKGVIHFTPFEEEEKEIGNLSDGNVRNNYLLIGSHVFPLERFPEIKIAWNELYPSGKPEPEVPKSDPQPTTEAYLLDFEYRLSKMELGV